MSPSRIHRLLQLIGLLQGGRGYNVDALSRECEVSRRTIFRDLELLRQAGIPLVYNEMQRGYRMEGSRLLPPTNFTPEEALSLIVLCQELGNHSGLPFFAPARNAAMKLESSLPARLRDYLRGTVDAVQIQPPPNNSLAVHKPVFDQFLEAVASRQCVRIRYNSYTEWEQICTRLSPYRLLFSRRSWYVIGRSSLHRATRTFNLSRVADAELLEDTYEIPAGFSVDRYLRNAWHLIPEPGTDSEVVVRFSKMVAQNVAEVTWHKTQKLTFNDDGTLDFRVKVSGLNEISWWILGYGDQAEVIRPTALRNTVAECAQRMVERYRGHRGSTLDT